MKLNLNSYGIKLAKLVERLSSRPKVGGLQITDSSVQYVYLGSDQFEPIAFFIKLPPGIVQGGKIQDPKSFLAALIRLHDLITGGKKGERVKVVVCLPSAITYTQSFSIPNVGRDRLKEAADLNARMISPIPPEKAYISWQLVKETPDQFELLGAFSEKSAVDQHRNFLEQANFYPVILEFPSLSLSWVINQVVSPREKSSLVLNVSSDGIDIFLLKSGFIYFDYFRSWFSIQGSDKRISREVFNNVIIEEVRKVVNFTSARFRESLQYAFLIAPGLETDIQQVLELNFKIKATPLVAKFGRLGPGWYAVIGSAIRGRWDRSKDRFISLGTERVEVLFYYEQIIDFIRLWRKIFAGVIAAFLVLYAGAALILRAQPPSLKGRLELLRIQTQEESLSGLIEKAREFNSLVSEVGKVKKESIPAEDLIDLVREMGDDLGILLDTFEMTMGNEVVSLSARAPDSQTVIKFKNFIEEDPRFSDVNLPFTKITLTEDNFTQFEMNFKFNPGKSD